MNLRSTISAAVLLGLASLIPAQGSAVHAAPTQQQLSAAFAPVVIESFSVMSPKAGQRESVLVRFVNNNKPVAGARLTAVLRVGKRTLLTAHGGTTNSKGKAQVGFSVPATARGKTVQVFVYLTYKGHKYHGQNAMKVQR